MNASAERLADKGVGSVFLYTHEAHPGEHYPHHQTMADKIRAAEGLQQRNLEKKNTRDATRHLENEKLK